MKYHNNNVSSTEKVTDNNAKKLILEKVLRRMGFTQQQILIDLMAKSNKSCAFS